jgi:membrane protein
MKAFDFIKELRLRLHRLLRSPTEEMGRGGKFLRYHVRLGLFCGRKLVKDRLQVTASALSYKTLLSLIPVLVLFTLILTIIPGGEIRQGIHDMVFEATGLKDIDVPGSDAESDLDTDSELPGEVDPGRPPVAGDVSGTPAADAKAERAGSVADQLTGMVEGVVADIQGGKGSITAISIVLFVWAGMSIFKTVEGAFNYIWEVRQGRNLFARFRDFLSSIVLLVLLLGVAFWWTRRFDVGAMIGGVSGVIPLVIAWLLFFVIYKTMPTVHVRNRAALTAAIVAGTMWELGAKAGFVLYVRHAVGVTQLYGALAMIPVFMIWVWLSWVIVLFGAELAYVIQYMRNLTQSLLEADRHARFLRPDLVALALAATIARRFVAGDEPPTRGELASEAGISESDAGEMLGVLLARGLLRNTERSDESRGYQPARPLDQITAGDIVEAASEAEVAPSSSGPQGRMLRWARAYVESISQDASSTLAGQTLASLARQGDD